MGEEDEIEWRMDDENTLLWIHITVLKFLYKGQLLDLKHNN
jgi:hypothetical protein